MTLRKQLVGCVSLSVKWRRGLWSQPNMATEATLDRER